MSDGDGLSAAYLQGCEDDRAQVVKYLRRMASIEIPWDHEDHRILYDGVLVNLINRLVSDPLLEPLS